MSTIRERDAELTNVESPEEWISHATWQAHADRRALLAAGDAMAEAAENAALQLVNLGAIVRTDPRYRGTPMATETMLRAALAAWKAATG